MVLDESLVLLCWTNGRYLVVTVLWRKFYGIPKKDMWNWIVNKKILVILDLSIFHYVPPVSLSKLFHMNFGTNSTSVFKTKTIGFYRYYVYFTYFFQNIVYYSTLRLVITKYSPIGVHASFFIFGYPSNMRAISHFESIFSNNWSLGK